VAEAAEARAVFVNAVDDPANATAFLSGVVRRGGVTIAISTTGVAPALTALLREALDALLPADLEAWVVEARTQRAVWRQLEVPVEQRKPLLLRSLNRLYPSLAEPVRGDMDSTPARTRSGDRDPRVPGLSAPAREGSGAEGPAPVDRAQGVLSNVERTRATEPGSGAEPQEKEDSWR
jgi:hypothetical protein